MNWKTHIVKTPIFPKLMENFQINNPSHFSNRMFIYMYVVNSCFVHPILIKPLSHHTAVKEVSDFPM